MNQTTNIRRILDRVMRHPMMRDIPFETAVEYAVDFISLMGTPALYEEKTAIVEVHNWRGQLPCDFEQMIQVRMAGSQHSNRWIDCCNRFRPAGPVYRYSGHSFHMSNMKPNEFVTGELTYKTQGMVIFTSTKDVDLEIAYRGYMIDDEGYPLLPDNASFLRGLENYIKLQWFTILFDMGKVSAQVFANVQQEYCWAVGDAQNEFSRLDLDKAETLFNSFKTLLPRNNEHWKAFFTAGSKELSPLTGIPRNGYYYGGSTPTVGGRVTGAVSHNGGGSSSYDPTPRPSPTPTPEPTPGPEPEPVVPDSPVFSLSNNVVTITCATRGATIYYRLTGSDVWTKYTGPLAISQNTSFEAYSVLGDQMSGVVSFYAEYDEGGVEPGPGPGPGPEPDVTANPVFALNNNIVTITCSTPGAVIYYKKAGESTWKIYTTGITITEDTTFEAYASANNVDSQHVIFFAEYDEDEPTIETLDYPMYYGGRETELLIDANTASVVSTFTPSNNFVTSRIPLNAGYYYLAAASIYSVESVVVPRTTEIITALFRYKGEFQLNGVAYKLYQFHLRSGLPLEEYATLTLVK